MPGPYGAGSRPPRRRNATRVGDGGKPKECCAMVAALRSARQGKFRLARRYAAWSVRLIVARFAA